MPRLLSRDAHPPGSFQIIIPEIGMGAPESGSFNHCVLFVLGVVRGNKFLAEKHGWSPTMEWAENYVEQQNVNRMLAHGWTTFLAMDAAEPVVMHRDIPAGDEGSKKNAAAGGGSKLAAGIGVLLKWLGPSGKAVLPDVAQRRALICRACPKNRKIALTDFFTEAAAAVIRTQMEMRLDMRLRTTIDDDLGICEACGCVNSLKVHVPLEFVLVGTTEQIRKDLHESCWITAEEKA